MLKTRPLGRAPVSAPALLQVFRQSAKLAGQKPSAASRLLAGSEALRLRGLQQGLHREDRAGLRETSAKNWEAQHVILNILGGLAWPPCSPLGRPRTNEVKTHFWKGACRRPPKGLPGSQQAHSEKLSRRSSPSTTPLRSKVAPADSAETLLSFAAKDSPKGKYVRQKK